MIEMMATNPSTPRMLGMITCQCVPQPVAPSISAASISSPGTPCSPAMITSIANGSMNQSVFSATSTRLGHGSVNHRISWPVAAEIR
jgi:hypothetical protein